jgi:FAD/FMN-containing dehydrogenase
MWSHIAVTTTLAKPAILNATGTKAPVTTSPNGTSAEPAPAAPMDGLAAASRARRYESWGRYPTPQHRGVKSLFWTDEAARLDSVDGMVLPIGYGRSYGDSCLNDGGTLIDITGLRRFISFDETTGLLRCEAGVMLADILEVMVPRGWFLPVTPGTKYVSIGGAIANDIHGKNHHVAGTFGRHVTQFELLRSDGEHLICSPEQNSGMFRATIGGLGLTGLILWAEFRLRRIPGPFIAKEQIRFESIDEFFELNKEFDKQFEYTVSWVDCLAVGKQLGRGYFMLGNHDRLQAMPDKSPKPKALLSVPINAPGFALNKLTVGAFNSALYMLQGSKRSRKVVPYDPFFYPLDAISNWNKLYGKAGFLQYQLVVPYTEKHYAIRDVLTQVAQSGEASFLVVMKTFGEVQSPGLLSFPRKGVTLSLDFPYRGDKTLRLLERLDATVHGHGGALYPAKDARMSAAHFQAFYPQWREFSEYVDPKFSSNFWRRVSAEPTR